MIGKARSIRVVPGHEIVGRVTERRRARQKIQGRRHRRRRLHGVDSCRTCDNCKEGY